MQVIDLGEHRRRKQDRSTTWVSIDYETKTLTLLLRLPILPGESQAAFLRRFMLNGGMAELGGRPIAETLAGMDDPSVAHFIASVAINVDPEVNPHGR
jgi:hypothetical protein